MAILTFKYPLVYVEWDDAETDNGWEEIPANLKEALAITVGFLVKETEKHLMIASSYDTANNHTNGRIQIPRGMVKSLQVIKANNGVRKDKDKKVHIVEAVAGAEAVGQGSK